MRETDVIVSGKYWREYHLRGGEESSVNFEDSYQVRSKDVAT
jgi:hypothetical protein